MKTIENIPSKDNNFLNFDNIINLAQNIEKLDPELKIIFNRLFDIRVQEISLEKLPEEYNKFENQILVFVKDKIKSQEAIFNPTRQVRPQPTKTIEQLEQNYPDPFCNVYEKTPEDELGRLENDSAITAANLSKMADYHSLVIFKKHNFYDLNEKDFIDAISLANLWFEKIKEIDPEIKSKILIWNYGFRSGASILHPHFQILVFKDEPLSLITLKSQLENYSETYNSNYFDDYFKLAQELKIGDEENNFKIWFSLTPQKEKGMDFYGQLNENSAKFLWKILQKLIKTGTQNFNIFYNYDLNYGFFVDRGENQKSNSDIGSLEIFGPKVISSDPFQLAKYIFS